MTGLLEGEKVILTDIDCELIDVDPFPADVYAAARAIPGAWTEGSTIGTSGG